MVESAVGEVNWWRGNSSYKSYVMQVTHNNHFVPQSYLRRRSEDRHRIWCYRILVSQKKVHEWKLQSLEGAAFRRDLYTDLVGGQEIDAFFNGLYKDSAPPQTHPKNRKDFLSVKNIQCQIIT
jgi:hypothetical protein